MRQRDCMKPSLHVTLRIKFVVLGFLGEISYISFKFRNWTKLNETDRKWTKVNETDRKWTKLNETERKRIIYDIRSVPKSIDCGTKYRTTTSLAYLQLVTRAIVGHHVEYHRTQIYRCWLALKKYWPFKRIFIDFGSKGLNKSKNSKLEKDALVRINITSIKLTFHNFLIHAICLLSNFFDLPVRRIYANMRKQ